MITFWMMKAVRKSTDVEQHIGGLEQPTGDNWDNRHVYKYTHEKLLAEHVRKMRGSKCLCLRFT